MAVSGATITQVPWTGIGTDPNASTATPGAAVDTTALHSTVSDILGLKATAVTDTANAAASTTQAAGYAAEGAAYGTAAEVANQNAFLSEISGSVKTLQEQRALTRSLGEQTAQIAASGFAASGSNLDILRSSLQEGYITQQLTAVQTALQKGGYLEEAAAAKAEQAATDVTSKAATSQAAASTAASTTSTANAAAETASLNKFLSTATLTSAQKAILDPLGSDITTSSTAVSSGVPWADAARSTFTGAPAVTTAAAKPIVYGNKI